MPATPWFRSLATFAVGGFLLLSAWNTQAEPLPISVYGRLPAAQNTVISPDGKHYAFVRHDGDESYFIVVTAESRDIVGGGRLDTETRTRDLYFVTDDHLLMRASETQRFFRSGGRKTRFSAAFAYSISQNKTYVLLNRSKDLATGQSGLGRIVGVNAQKKEAYMPAYGKKRGFSYDLFRVDLDNGRAVRHARGRSHTIDWWVDSNGNVLAREDFNSERDYHKIFAYDGKKPREIYHRDGKFVEFVVAGVSDDEQSLLLVDDRGNDEAVYKMALADGAISGPFFARDGREIHYLDTDLNRKLVAVAYTGLRPEFEFMDSRITDMHERLCNTFASSTVTYTTSTDDMQTHLFDVSGGDQGIVTIRAQGTPPKLAIINRSYPDIGNTDVATVVTWSFKARDGLDIPSLITLPPGLDTAAAQGLPLIVMPHGGPETFDYQRFDWWAQAMASRGYVVLQPNFRGSSGFGTRHLLAGRGEWGARMQDDVSDGVAALVTEGIADPERVCIMGASYGGYSALAGGAFTPELYRCVVAVAGVSDLPRMLSDTARKMGRYHWVNDYWEAVIGDRKEDREKLKDISPARFAEAFQAPVLLIHGRDDTVVPYRQSKIMHDALKRAKRPSKLVLLDGEDHNLSEGSTRLQMLEEIEGFLAQHNPIGQAASDQ